MTEHAIEIDRYGGPEELVWREVQRPALAPDEVRIRTLYAAVNRADIEIRRGEWPIVRGDPFPYTPGLEVVGVVDGVGDRVTGIWPGAQVITMMQRLGGIWGERPGGYGEFVVVRADTVASFPPEVDAEQIAALGLAAVTAAEGLARLDLRRRRASSCTAPAAASARPPSRWRARAAVRSSRSCRAPARTTTCARSVRPGSSASTRRGCSTRSAPAASTPCSRRPARGRSPTAPPSCAAAGGCASSARSPAASCALSAWDLMQELVLTGWSSENLTGDALREHVTRIAELVRGGLLPAPAIHRFALADAAGAHAQIEAGGAHRPRPAVRLSRVTAPSLPRHSGASTEKTSRSA